MAMDMFLADRMENMLECPTCGRERCGDVGELTIAKHKGEILVTWRRSWT
jgi:hypothetical protein